MKKYIYGIKISSWFCSIVYIFGKIDIFIILGRKFYLVYDILVTKNSSFYWIIIELEVPIAFLYHLLIGRKSIAYDLIISSCILFYKKSIKGNK